MRPQQVADYVFLVHGNRTPENRPYQRVASQHIPGDDAGHESSQAIKPCPSAIQQLSGISGRCEYDCRFCTRPALQVTLSVSRKQPGSRGQWTAANGGATFNAHGQRNSQLTASDLTGTGDLAGLPERGSQRIVLTARQQRKWAESSTPRIQRANRVISGYFGGKKDQ